MEKIETLEGRIHRNRREAGQAFERIKADASLSESGKAQQLEDAWERADAAHRRLWTERKTAIAEHSETLRTRAFGPVYRMGEDQTAVRTAYREALQRAAAAKDAGELTRMLELAELSGDALGKRAIAAAAYAAGHGSILARVTDPDITAFIEFERTYGESMSAEARLAERMQLTGPSKPRGASGAGVGRAA